jgi:hypothetical protein
MTGPVSLYTGTTAPTTAYAGDATTKVATDQFVQNAINYSMATVPLTLSTGTYSFDAASTCAPTIGFTASGNISAIGTIYAGGTGCVVGDLLSVGGGNHDAILQVATLTGSAAASLNIVYGGTGYTSAINIATSVASSVPFTFLLSGALSGNVTLVMTNGTYLTQSNQWIFADNTTGNPTYAVTVCVAGATDACAAGGRTVTLVEGTNNSTSRILQTDGELNVDFADPVTQALAVAAIAGQAIAPASISSTTTGTTQTAGDNSTKLATTAYAQNPGPTAPSSVTTSALTVNAVANVGAPTGSPSGSGGTVAASSTNFLYISCVDNTGNHTTAAANKSANVVTSGSTSSIVWSYTLPTGCTTPYAWPATSGTPAYYTALTPASTSWTQTLPAASYTAAASYPAGGAFPASNTTGPTILAGSVGIGTTSPASLLGIAGALSLAYGSAGGGPSIAIQNSTNSNIGGTIFFSGSGGAGGSLRWISAQSSATGTGAGDLGFGLNGVSNTPQLIVKLGGNVGIGTTSPGSSLTVKGGDAFVDGTATGVILRDTVTTTNCYRITIASGLVVPTLVTCPTD